LILAPAQKITPRPSGFAGGRGASIGQTNRSAFRAVVWNPFQANYLLQQPELQPDEQQLLAQQPPQQW
jgi:hypothetical protein